MTRRACSRVGLHGITADAKLSHLSVVDDDDDHHDGGGSAAAGDAHHHPGDAVVADAA